MKKKKTKNSNLKMEGTELHADSVFFFWQKFGILKKEIAKGGNPWTSSQKEKLCLNG